MKEFQQEFLGVFRDESLEEFFKKPLKESSEILAEYLEEFL